jgi:hypothetical protein
MRGEFIGIWSDLTREVWEPLAQVDGAPDDLFCELYRSLSVAFAVQLTAEELANIVDNTSEARDAFYGLSASHFSNERALTAALEQLLEALDDLGGVTLSDPYFLLLEGAIQKFSLRYELRRPCLLCPTLPGIFSNLVRDLRTHTNTDAHLSSLLSDFEASVRDLRVNNSTNQMKTCIQKQVNLLEALGGQLPAVTGNTLGAICDQANTWPHAKVKDAIKLLYGFACDYPGIRHGGNAANQLRVLELRDVMAISILLAGFVPYLTDGLNFENLYGSASV